MTAIKECDRQEIVGPGKTPSGGGGGEANTASNIGLGIGVFKQKSALNLEFKSLLADGNVSISSAANEVSLALSDTGVSAGAYTNTNITVDPKGRITSAANGSAGSGEANTASNLGGGEGVFSSKLAVDLRFKSLLAGDGVQLSSDASEILIEAKPLIYIQAECMAQVVNSDGLFSRSITNQNNPGGLPITDPSNVFLNGGLAPFVFGRAYNIEHVTAVVAGACVSTVTVGAAPTFRFDFWRENVNNRTFISTQRAPCVSNASFIGNNSNPVPASSFIYFGLDISATPIAWNSSEMMGWQFEPEQGSQDTINGFNRCITYMGIREA